MKSEQGVFAGIDFRVPLRALRHAEKSVELREDDSKGADLTQELDGGTRCRFVECARELAPYALGHQGIGFARVDHSPHEREGLRRDRESEVSKSRNETRNTQNSYRVFDERWRHVTQQAFVEVRATTKRIDDVSRDIAGHRVDGEVTASKILLECDGGRELGGESAIARSDFAFESREGVFLAGLRVKKYREVFAHGTIAARFELGGGRADHDPVSFAHRAIEQLIADGAAYEIDLHPQMLARWTDVRGRDAGEGGRHDAEADESVFLAHVIDGQGQEVIRRERFTRDEIHDEGLKSPHHIR